MNTGAPATHSPRAPARLVPARLYCFALLALSWPAVAAAENVEAFDTRVDPASLPRTLDGYSETATVGIDARTLNAFDDDQLRALLEFAGTCGKILLIDVSPGVADVFRRRAACGGGFLRTTTSTADVEVALLDLERLPPARLASDTQLESLLAGTAVASPLSLPRLGLFLLLYAALAAALLASAHTRPAGLALGLITALLAPALWPPDAVRGYAAWAEATGDERVAAYRGLERVASFESGTLVFADTRSRGSFAVSPTLEVTARGDAIILCNPGPADAAATHLYWRDGVYALPRLPPGERWTSTGVDPLGKDALAAPEFRMLRQRSMSHELALLRPLPATGRSGQAWLLRFDAGRKEREPCSD